MKIKIKKKKPITLRAETPKHKYHGDLKTDVDKYKAFKNMSSVFHWDFRRAIVDNKLNILKRYYSEETFNHIIAHIANRSWLNEMVIMIYKIALKSMCIDLYPNDSKAQTKLLLSVSIPSKEMFIKYIVQEKGKQCGSKKRKLKLKIKKK